MGSVINYSHYQNNKGGIKMIENCNKKELEIAKILLDYLKKNRR